MVSPVDDAGYLKLALEEAKEGLGRVWPNPSVGCVLVKDGELIGRARTADHGRPHAEVLALRQAGDQARGATAYVTLEPCNHWGRTAPCTDALLDAGVVRVVVALEDPDPRVNGSGIQRLRDHGIQVDVGLLEAEAREVNAGFLMRVAHGRPLVGCVTVHEPKALAATLERFDAFLCSEGVAQRRGIVHPKRRHIVVSAPTDGSVPKLGLGRAREARLRELGFELLAWSAGDERQAAVDALGVLGQGGFTRVLVSGLDPLSETLARHGLIDIDLR